MELLWSQFSDLSGGGFVFLYLLTHLSCQISRGADGGPVPELTEGRLAHPHFLSLLTFRLTNMSMELVEDKGVEGGVGAVAVLRICCRSTNFKEAERRSIRFDGKQLEQRMK